jgi:hypothetical protein
MSTWEKWRFSQDAVTAERQRYLGEETDFSQIGEAIAQEIEITKFCVQNKPSNPMLKNCSRPEFQFRVNSKTFDLFYNSPWGYRGQYCMGKENGLSKNNYLISLILDSLIGHANSNPTPKLGTAEIERSLRMSTAKVWIAEDGQVDPKDLTLREELLHTVWLRNARKARSALDSNKTPDPEESQNAITGVRAPEGTLLDVKGAWVNIHGEERVVNYKQYRAEHIANYGFS